MSSKAAQVKNQIGLKLGTKVAYHLHGQNISAVDCYINECKQRIIYYYYVTFSVWDLFQWYLQGVVHFLVYPLSYFPLKSLKCNQSTKSTQHLKSRTQTLQPAICNKFAFTTYKKSGKVAQSKEYKCHVGQLWINTMNHDGILLEV